MVFPVPVPPTRIRLWARSMKCLSPVAQSALAKWRFRPVDPGQVAVDRETGGLHLVTQAADLSVRLLGIDQSISHASGCIGRRGPSASSSDHAVAMP